MINLSSEDNILTFTWKESSTLPWLRPQMYSMQVWECTVGMLYIIQMHSCLMLIILLRKPKPFLRIDCEIIFRSTSIQLMDWTKFPPYRKNICIMALKGKPTQTWKLCHHLLPLMSFQTHDLLSYVEHKRRYFNECWYPDQNILRKSKGSETGHQHSWKYLCLVNKLISWLS